MRDATALVERLELRSAGSLQTIDAGFRDDGRLSLYFGDDPYYQFDAEGRLRRAFVDGRIVLSQGSGLKALTRERTAEATILSRHDLTAIELEAFLKTMLERVAGLKKAIASGALYVVTQVPSDAPIVERLVERLQSILSEGGQLAPPINRVR